MSVKRENSNNAPKILPFNVMGQVGLKVDKSDTIESNFFKEDLPHVSSPSSSLGMCKNNLKSKLNITK